MEPFVAMIMAFAGNYAPRGWAFCMGQLVSIAQNQPLFSLIGTTYGGDGQTTFALPDLRGRALIGQGQAPGRSNYDLGQTGGAESVILTLNNLPSHTHTADVSTLVVTPSASTATGTTNIPGPTLVPAALPQTGSGPTASTIKGYAVKNGSTTLAADTVTGNVTIGLTGSNTPVATQDPYLAISYVIAFEGVYPSRN
ncbi:Microcystin-dependent protein [Chitinophaga sp. CF118]|uniref:phage tail protein n=1 Tax=Chitinophaga sp. CF118 TaxID=1884367 RepID=UPI0008E3C4F7|nr:tail fiber protein [Chitinophaga sp. CF118]SFD61487.1 Microcystin-dependent protein [Chitinophaga sp. CF118]